ncbi:MAG: tandem-95 repeat protein [Pirellulaceae bacterium]
MSERALGPQTLVGTSGHLIRLLWNDNMMAKTPSSSLNAARSVTETRRSKIDFMPLEDRVLYSAVPMDLTVLEDAQSTQLNLEDHFSLDDQPGAEIQYLLTENSHPELFNQLTLSDDGSVLLDYADHAHGETVLTFTATDADGQLEEFQLNLTIESVNDLPTITDIADQGIREDSGQSYVRFRIGDQETAAGDLTVSARSLNEDLIASDNLQLVANSSSFYMLRFQPNADVSGTAALSIEVQDQHGGLTVQTFEVQIDAVNDAPIFLGFNDSNVTTLPGQTIVDLHAAFWDAEDGAEWLTYSVQANSHPELIESITIDQQAGKLIVQHADDATGSVELNIVATDSGGLSVGSIKNESLQVMDSLLGQLGLNKPDTSKIGMSQATLWTSWYLFDYNNGEYDFSHLNEAWFRQHLASSTHTAEDGPIVFNLENEYYVNSEAGRDNIAEIFKIAHEVRPDLEFGMYRVVPERSWAYPVNHFRATEDAAAGLETWYTARADQFLNDYQQWHDRNELFRTEDVSESLGGQPVYSYMGSVNPSLYTFQYEDADRMGEPQQVTLDADANTLHNSAASLDTVRIVRFDVESGGKLPAGLQKYVDYYVVNADRDSFQLSLTEGGPPIDLTDVGEGRIYITPMGETGMLHNRNVMDWAVYARENVAEAAKFDLPTYAWISPSYKGTGVDYLSYDFFRLQLETLAPIVDGIVIYDPSGHTARFHESADWYAAVQDFLAQQELPAAMLTIDIGAESLPQGSLVAAADYLTASEDEVLSFDLATLLRNDQTFKSIAPQIEVISNVSHGSLEVMHDGTYRYTPNANFYGQDSFTYMIQQGAVRSNEVTVTVDVVAVNDAPVAQDDRFATVEDHSLTLQVNRLLRNDSDAEGSELAFTLVSTTANGSLRMNTDGSLTYVPEEDFFGTDSFTYLVSDGGQLSNLATATIYVLSSNDTPQANSDSLTTDNTQALIVTSSQLLANDLDPDGDVLSVRIVEATKHGSLTQNTDGSWTYRPNAGFVGEDSLVYQAFDGKRYSAETTLQIRVEDGNVAPVAGNDVLATVEDHALHFNASRLLRNDVDADADPLTVQIVSGPAHGSIQEVRPGEFRYLSDQEFSGIDLLTYRLFDGHSYSNEAEVKIHVLATNDAPTASDVTLDAKESQPRTISVEELLVNASDVDDTELSVKITVSPKHGQLVQRSDGSFEYRPDSGFSGQDAFEYRVTDGRKDSAAVTAHVMVAEDVQLPVVNADRVFTVEDHSVTVLTSRLLRNDKHVTPTRRWKLFRAPRTVR